MKPIRPRTQIWPLAALPSAAAVALVAASIGFADDGPASPSKAAQAANSTLAAQSQSTAPAPGHPEGRPQLSYEVRWLEFAAHSWRDHMQDRLRPSGEKSEDRGWVVDKEGMNVLTKHLLGDITARMLQAPKVTAFEGTSATFIVDLKSIGISAESVVISPDSVDVKQGVAETLKRGPVDTGCSRVDIKGLLSPRGSHISVNLNGPTRVTTRPDRPESSKAEEAPSRPDVGAFYYEGSCDVPTGSSLLVSLGRYERRGEAKTGMRERLLVITPHRFPLKPEPTTSRATLRSPADLPAPR